ncbi:MAG TPA: hypothetical protein VKM55_15260 [Candidatus Lokiarchaeia archaeon]|nr:hypothetical protein [Candidatus Lokiarchaeia archaeon]
MAEIKNMVYRVVTILDTLKLPYVIVGGFAAIVRGTPRTTTDLDLIIENDPVNVHLFLNALKRNDFDVMEGQTKIASVGGSTISILDDLSPLRVDLKIARKLDDVDALKHGVWEDYEGMKIRIASTELILFGKVLYIGDISSESDANLLEFNDVRDFINVYNRAENIDMAWLSTKVAKKGLTETLKHLINLAKNESLLS